MEAFVTRQPIFDANHRIIAYELRHRDKEGRDSVPDDILSPEAEGDGEEAENKLNRLFGGKMVFVSFSRGTLLTGIPDTLDPKGIVVQLLDPVEPDDAVVEACKAAAGRGFRFAFGDWVLHEKYARLLRFAAVVKIDVQAPQFDERVVLAEKLPAFRGKLLARNVEHRTAHDACVAMGFELFEGFHYFRPETLEANDLAGPSIAVVQALNLLKDPNSGDRKIQEALESDPSLSYKLLRLVNSVAMGGRGTDSIAHALRMMGRDPLYRWLSMLLLSGDKTESEVRNEIVKSSILRARLCELLRDHARPGTEADLPTSQTLFLIGLFSHLDTLLQMPMENILSRIVLAEGVEDALLGRKGRAGVILSAVENYEEADWDIAEERLGFAQVGSDDLSGLYLDSVTWASDRMEGIGG